MIIAGAGGHGLEVALVLQNFGMPISEILFFDQDTSKSGGSFTSKNLILEEEVLIQKFKEAPEFCLGVGNPVAREKLYTYLISLGGSNYGINSMGIKIDDAEILPFDAMPLSFIGPNTKIGHGVLINTRAHVHHDCEVGKFSEIAPGAMLLGGAKIGDRCRIGAGAVILPGVQLGDEIIVGAGAVVTKDYFEKGGVLKGIPAKPKQQ